MDGLPLEVNRSSTIQLGHKCKNTEMAAVNPIVLIVINKSLWRHEMETFYVLLNLCDGKSPVTGGFPSQRASNADFVAFFDVILNTQLHKQSIAGDLRLLNGHFDMTIMWMKRYTYPVLSFVLKFRWQWRKAKPYWNTHHAADPSP